MADGKYVPEYWEKYGVEPAVQFPVTDWAREYPPLKRQLYAEQKRLKGMEYGDTDRAKIIQQIEDAQMELDRLLNAFVGSSAQEFGSRPVVPKKKEPWSGVAGMIQRGMGAGQEESRPLNP